MSIADAFQERELEERVTELKGALRQLLNVTHHDCGVDERTHLVEHVVPASSRALAALSEDES